MNNRWDELLRELDAWAEEGREATFWLRDDDAVADTPALVRLVAIGERTGIPLCLAVIPKDAGEDLADAVSRAGDTFVIQHGWCHQNHAGPQEKKFELGDHRPLSVVGDELARGDAKLRTLFGDRYMKILAPPWNRIGPKVAAGLAGWGYRGLSVFGPRHKSIAAPGVVRCNTHVDIIDWKGTRGFRGTQEVLSQAVAHLAARRTGEADAAEPTGLITHHLVHDEGSWAFIEEFAERTRGHAAGRWLSAADVFAGDISACESRLD